VFAFLQLFLEVTSINTKFINTEFKIINAEFLFIQMHNIHFRKLLGGEGGRKAEGSPRAPDTFAVIQTHTNVLVIIGNRNHTRENRD
jgi:hypothetical protein